MVNKIPLNIEGINEKFYSGFWPRLGANLLDGLINIPYVFLLSFINSFHLYTYLITVIPNILFIFWYNVYLPKKLGGTPGKLIVGLNIVKIDSSQIGWKEAFLRHSINIVFSFLFIIMTIASIFMADIEIYNSLSWFEKNTYLASISNINIVSILSNIWIWSEIVVLLFNKRKRAVHDFIAGTVIIKTEYLEEIRMKMDELNSEAEFTNRSV
ncbi:MAG: RDD family protein [Treponema sp.]|nr:RDD family protein [Treponema sp.]